MSTLIDGSCLLTSQPTGVSMVVGDLLRRNILPIATHATIFTINSQKKTHPLPDTSLQHIHRRIPSKLTHAFCIAGGSLEQLAPGSWSRLFLPNINIVGIPRIPYDLLVHDLSFLLHEPWFSYKTRLWHRFAQPQTLIQRAERLFTLSPQTSLALMDVCDIPKERVHQITYQPQPITHYAIDRPLAQPYFLLLASQDPRKNSACVLQAFESFYKDHPDWRLILIGGDPTRTQPGVIHHPYLSTMEKQAWLCHAAALVYPSWYEGFGLPAHEAAALGIPVLASSAITVTRTAPQNATFLPPYTPHAWLKAFERLT